MHSPATVVQGTPPPAADLRETLTDSTCGLIEDPAFQDRPVRDYIYAIETYGDYSRTGSVELINHLRLKVTSVEALICGERGDNLRHPLWRTEMAFLNGLRSEPAYLDDADDCVAQYMRSGWKHDTQYGGWMTRLAADGCTNPIMLFNRVKIGFDTDGERLPWKMQALMADHRKGRDEMKREIAHQEKRCHGVFEVVHTNTRDLEWRRVRTGTVYTTEPTNESIAAERARVAVSKKRSREGEAGGPGKKAQCPPKSARAGGGAMPFVVGSKRAVTKDVNTKRPTPTDVQVPENGLVPYRTDAVEHNPIGERECVIEALRAALGTRSVTRVSLGLPLKGDLNFKEVVAKFNEVRSPFEFRKSPPVPWSGLLTKEPGIYIGRALLRTGEAHYMVYDAWRHLIFVGGAPPPPAVDEVDQFLYYDEQRPEDMPANVGRSWFIEEHELLDPAKFQKYMCETLNVVGGINNLYSVHMYVKHARKTEYNTPEHYD